MSTECLTACPISSGVNGACHSRNVLQVETSPAPALGEALQLWQREATFGVCDTGRYRARYYLWGQGPPLVFVHGLADRARSFVPAIAALRQHFTCMAYELAEGVDDGARIGAYRHRYLVADLFALLDHLNFRRAYLFGSSFGSTITLAALHSNPKRLPRAVLQGGFAHRPLVTWEHMLCSFARYWPGPMSTLPLRGKLDRAADVGPFGSVPPEYRAFMIENCGAVAKSAAARRGVLVHHLDLRPVLPSITQPVLMICGDRDPIVPQSCEGPLLEGLPHVERVEFPNCGHYPQYTHAPLVAEIVRRFLTPVEELEEALPSLRSGRGETCLLR